MSEVVPSFFPTPNEIAGGIRWVRDHPVVATAAAAAATAVSVITFLRSHTLLEDDEQLDIPDGEIDLSPFDSRDLDEIPNPRERFQTWADQYPRKGGDTKDPVLDSHKRSRSNQEFTTHTLRKEAEEIYSNTDSEFSATSRLSRRNSPPSSAALCDGVEAEESPRAVDIPPTCIEGQYQPDDDDLDSASPQWGWYVSTTPPEDQYS